MKILIATEKPFAKEAVTAISEIVNESGNKIALLENYTDKAQLLNAVADADAIIVRSDIIDAEVVNAAKQLKIVVRAGAGYDNLDLDALKAKGVVAMNTPGQNANAVAELAIGMMIYMSRKQFTPGMGSELGGKKLGIHAYGNVGRLVAKHGKALGMTVIAHDPFITDKSIFAQDGVTSVDSVEELYANSDFLSLHIPANEHTIKSINYELLAKMPKGALLVNTARKEVIDQAGVEKALTERTDLKFATDVPGDAQKQLEEKFGVRVYGTPKKMGAQTAEANINAGVAAAKQIVDFFKTGNTKFQVNK